jgi:ATP-dependent RNA circularization protein (DNA/RNA ligase family)
MAEKYHIEHVLTEMLTLFPLAEWVTIQGETYGAGVQKRDYHLSGHDFMAFNLITSDKGRFNTLKMRELLEDYYRIPCVPVVDSKFILPDTVEELLEYATDKSQIDGDMREGIVFRSEDGSKSFKAVSNEFLLAYHG